jgi:hypothetical protein
MGSSYRPRYRGADGTLRESAVIWLKYRDALGILRRESSEAEKEQEARRLLKQREGAAVEGHVIIPRADRVTVAELADQLKADYQANKRRSLRQVTTLLIAHLCRPLGIVVRRRLRQPRSQRTRPIGWPKGVERQRESRADRAETHVLSGHERGAPSEEAAHPDARGVQRAARVL